MTVFISHSQKDEAIYTTLCLALDASSITRWDPSTMLPGDSLADQLQKAIQRCETCIFLATRRSIESTWCMAELGAFWGAGKKVLLFMADPDLAETILPPQFKGNLRVDTAEKLIESTKSAVDHNRLSDRNQYKFFNTSGSYGSDTDWEKLLDDSAKHFDILGIALKGWREMNNSTIKFLEKAQSGCSIRILFMHQDNELLNGLLYSEKKSRASVARDIEESLNYYKYLSSQNLAIEVRQIRRGIPHFFITRTDTCAVLIQYTSSRDWGSGPTWLCQAHTDLYTIAQKEFDYLWQSGSCNECC